MKLFKDHSFEPGEFLIQVASGADQSEEWDKRDRLRAANILMAHTYDKPQRESEQALIEQLRQVTQQSAPTYEIVYVKDQADFALPTEAGAARTQGPL